MDGVYLLGPLRGIYAGRVLSLEKLRRCGKHVTFHVGMQNDWSPERLLSEQFSALFPEGNRGPALLCLQKLSVQIAEWFFSSQRPAEVHASACQQASTEPLLVPYGMTPGHSL